MAEVDYDFEKHNKTHRCVLVLGNLSEGYRVIGPFGTFDEAAYYSDRNCDGDGWVMNLEEPK